MPATLRKMGKLPPRYNKKALHLGDYFDLSKFDTPEIVTWDGWTAGGISMLGNDQYGDCTCASMVHLIQQVSTAAGNPIVMGTDDALAAYATITGFNLATGQPDNGANMGDVLNYAKNTGFGGHKIAGYAAVSANNFPLQHAALFLFGNVWEGWALPQALQDENYPTTWAVNGRGPTWAAGSLGGHATLRTVSDKTTQATKTATWNEEVDVELSFRRKYQDELHVIFTNDWIETSGNSPSGFNKDALISDMRLVGQIEG